MKSTLHALGETGMRLSGIAHDTMLYSYLLDPTYSAHTLPGVALRRLGLKLSGSLAEAADITLRLASALGAEVEAEAELEWLYREIDLPLAFVLHGMEQAGVQLDCDVLKEMAASWRARSGGWSATIHEQAGVEFNVNSPKQLGDVLFNRMGLPQAVEVRQGEDDFDGAGCAGGTGRRA